MNSNTTAEQQAVRDEVRTFAAAEIAPVSRRWDQMPEPREFPRDIYQKPGRSGFIGYSLPVECGGRGNSNLEYITLTDAQEPRASFLGERGKGFKNAR